MPLSKSLVRLDPDKSRRKPESNPGPAAPGERTPYPLAQRRRSGNDSTNERGRVDTRSPALDASGGRHKYYTRWIPSRWQTTAVRLHTDCPTQRPLALLTICSRWRGEGEGGGGGGGVQGREGRGEERERGGGGGGEMRRVSQV